LECGAIINPNWRENIIIINPNWRENIIRVDYNDVFSPVVKHSSIHAFFGIVAMRDLELE
jgi:hypothetical protein